MTEKTALALRLNTPEAAAQFFDDLTSDDINKQRATRTQAQEDPETALIILGANYGQMTIARSANALELVIEDLPEDRARELLTANVPLPRMVDLMTQLGDRETCARVVASPDAVFLTLLRMLTDDQADNELPDHEVSDRIDATRTAAERHSRDAEDHLRDGLGARNADDELPQAYNWEQLLRWAHIYREREDFPELLDRNLTPTRTVKHELLLAIWEEGDRPSNIRTATLNFVEYGLDPDVDRRLLQLIVQAAEAADEEDDIPVVTIATLKGLLEEHLDQATSSGTPQAPNKPRADDFI